MKREVNNECAYVIDDVRFPNEVEAIRRWGGVVWCVIGRGSVEDSQHISEAQSFVADRLIYNDGTVEQLEYIIEEKMGDRSR